MSALELTDSRPTLAELGSKAVGIERLRLDRADVRRRRNELDCEHESNVPPLVDACWKRGESVGDDWRWHPRDAWCDRCVQRQALHEEYVRVSYEISGIRQSLTKRARRYAAEQDARVAA